MVNDIKGANYPPGEQADVLQRFLDTVRDLVAMGFFVLLDNQMQQDKLVQVCLSREFCSAERCCWKYALFGGHGL